MTPSEKSSITLSRQEDLAVNLELPLAKHRVQMQGVPASCESRFHYALLFRDLGDLFPMGVNDTIYPILDFAGYAIAVAESRAEIMRHSFIVHPHDRFPAF